MVAQEQQPCSDPYCRAVLAAAWRFSREADDRQPHAQSLADLRLALAGGSLSPFPDACLIAIRDECEAVLLRRHPDPVERFACPCDTCTPPDVMPVPSDPRIAGGAS